MDAERLKQIEKIYHAASGIDPAERAVFLDENCGSDEELRRELESLLSFQNRSDNFLDTPPESLAAELFFEPDAIINLTGKKISHYEIKKLLGRGGMGDVYLAEDVNLKRQVALKFLPAELTGNTKRLKRFEREAQTASALNHPNILTIHEFGTENEFHFLAAEYVEGETLRQIINGGNLSLTDVINIAEQTAFALSATHAANISHRDIKPENIMIRRDKIVKVLDFGLAKLAEERRGDAGRRGHEKDNSLLIEASRLRAPASLTNPGMILGTPDYMSPEQTRGRETDPRTDLWSLGVVLYEMLTGRLPFEGETMIDSVTAILTKPPPPLALYIPNVPAELQRIVQKALTKKRDGRYQTAQNLMTDLKTLRRELELRGGIERSNPPQTKSTNIVSTGENGPQNTDQENRKLTPNNSISENDGAYSASSGTYPAKNRTRLRSDGGGASHTAGTPATTTTEIESKTKTVKFLLFALVSFLLIGISFVTYNQFFKIASSSRAPFDKLEFDRLTADGLVKTTAISPDGKYIAFARKAGNNQSLWLRQTNAPGEVNIVPANQFDYQFLSFSKNEDFLYFVAAESEGKSPALYRVTTLGQNQRKLITSVHSQISFSPDGKQLAFARKVDDSYSLLVADLETGNEKVLAVRKYPEVYTEGVSWSPDGKRIAVATLRRKTSFAGGISVIDVETGEETPLPLSEKVIRISHIAWLPDGGGLLFCQYASPTGERYQIRYALFPGGEIRNVTNDMTSYEDLSVSADGKHLAAVQREYSMSIWVLPEGRVENAVQINPYVGRDDGERGIAWTGDGRIVYVSSEGGAQNLWRMDANGTNQTPLTTGNDYGNVVPALSLEGRFLTFLSDRGKGFDFWRMNFDGQNITRLTNDKNAEVYAASANEEWIVFTSSKNDKPYVWKKSFQRDEAVQLTETRSWNPVISPDGERVAFFQKENGQSLSLGLISIDGGQPIRYFELPATVNGEAGLSWSKDGNSIMFVNSTGTFSNIWRQNLSGGEPKPVTDFRQFQIAAFAWSLDGKSLAVSRGSRNRDVVLIKITANQVN